ncbi:MAG: alpha/beta hydrolase [Solirubrobacteraceae bacterium]|nr:alpha/beta hydrolase [Patulibacter sp.]
MARFLLLHGFGGVGPDHWLVWLSQELRARGHVARLRKLPSPNAPVLEAWMASLTERLAALGDEPELQPAGAASADISPAPGLARHADARSEAGDRSGELIVVAHSLGARLWLHHALEGGHGLPVADRVALVALPKLPELPPEQDPVQHSRFYALDVDVATVDPSRVAKVTRAVVSDNDHFWPGAGAIPNLIEPLGLPVDLLPGAGHFEPKDGFGPWPGLLAWCLGEAETIER